MNTSGGLFRHTLKICGHLSPFIGQTFLKTFLDDSKNLLEFKVISRVLIWKLLGLGEMSLGLDTFMDEKGSITTIINENIWTITTWPCEHFVGAIPVLLKVFTLPGEDVGGLGLDDSSSGVVLGGINIA